MLPKHLLHPGDFFSLIVDSSKSCKYSIKHTTRHKKQVWTHMYLAEFKEGSPEISTSVTLDIILQVLLVILMRKSQY